MAEPVLDAPPWRPRGAPLRDWPLVERVNAALGAVGEGLRVSARPGHVDADTVLTALDAAIAQVRAPKKPEVDALVALLELRGDVRAAVAAEPRRTVAGLQQALSRLRGATTAEQLLKRAPEVVADCLDFDRVIISRVKSQVWIPVEVYIRGHPEWAARILTAGVEAELALDQLVLETEMVRRRRPLLVRDVQERRDVHMPIALTSDSRSYVAAPIMPEGVVIGFLHADLRLSGRHPDELHRDALFAFAEAFGSIVERTAILDRLDDLERQTTDLTAALQGSFERIRSSEVRLMRDEEDEDDLSHRPTRAPAPPADHRILGLLTPRELEVVRFMAAGLSNRDIAAQLVVTEGTIKSHVKHILRKLRVANRAEATSTYMRMVARAPDLRP